MNKFFKTHIPLGSSFKYVMKVQERSVVPIRRFVLSNIHTVQGCLTSTLRISHSSNRKQRALEGC